MAAMDRPESRAPLVSIVICVYNGGPHLRASVRSALGQIDTQYTNLADDIATRPWQALELTKLALRLHRPATTAFDLAGQAVLFESDEKRRRMTTFVERRASP